MGNIPWPGTMNKAVPLFDAKIQYQALQVQMNEAARRVMASGHSIGGPEVAAFEQDFAKHCGANFAIACASGTDAILLALKAMDIGPGDEVITTPFTFFATAASICRLGATPVFVDIEEDTLNMDVHQVANRITDRTKAIMPVHLYGQCCDMEPLWQLAERHNIVIIEDAAQSTGASYQNKRCGTLGGMAAFSFYPTKNLGANGDGGMVVTNDPEWAKMVRCLASHGAYKRYYHDHLGWNSRLDAMQAAILRVKLPFVDRWIDARKAMAHRYDEMIDDNQLGYLLKKPTVRSYGEHSFNQYVVRVSNGQRNALRDHLTASQVGTEIYYPLPLHLQNVFTHLGHKAGDFPVTEKACGEVLALPIFPELQIDQQRKVIYSCAEFVKPQATLRRAA